MCHSTRTTISTKRRIESRPDHLVKWEGGEKVKEEMQRPLASNAAMMERATPCILMKLQHGMRDG
jgi:hypothetical protein